MVEARGTDPDVKFCLFGRFRIIVNGRDVPFPDVLFFTYLKLALLSRKTFFDYSRASGKDIPTKVIRDVLDKGNLKPRIGQGGRYDFAGITGLSLRYRERFGIELQGTGWECDVHTFEEIWAERDTAPIESLRLALALYGSGVDIRSWKRDQVLLDCSEWLQKRLTALQRRRDDINVELQSRLQSDEQMVVEPRGDETSARELSGDGNQHETSGLDQPESSLDTDPSSSAGLGGVVREKVSADSASFGIHSASTGGNVGSTQAARSPQSQEDLVQFEPRPSEPSDEQRVFLPVAEPRRTLSSVGLGIVVTAAIVLIGTGYLWGRLSSRGSNTNTGGVPDGTPNQVTPVGGPKGGAAQPKGGTKTETPPHTDFKAPPLPNPVELSSLYLSMAEGDGIDTKREDIVIGHRIYTGGYIGAGNGPMDVDSPVFKLDREFTSVRCVVGVPDNPQYPLESAGREVIFEGDGQVLKRVKMSPGRAVPVVVPVKGVKALVISFALPVVIVAGEARR